MKIVIYWEYFQRYHNARIAALLRLGQEQGHCVLPVSMSEDGFHGHQAERDEYVDTHAIYLKPTGGEVRPIDDDAVIQEFIDLLDQEKPDVVSVVGWYGKGTRRIINWASINKKKVILMLAGSQHDQKRNFIKEGYKRYVFMPKIHAVLCGGISHVRYAKQLGMPAERIFTGYNSVDNAFWSSMAESARSQSSSLEVKLGLKAQQYFITVGRFIEKKNFEALIDQYSNYRNAVGSSAWDLVIAGDGELRPRIEAKIDVLGLTDCVKLTGYLSSEELAPYLGLAGAFVLPSSEYEQWGLVVNEAMAAGLPVIVSGICGCVEDLVISGKTGYSFSPSSMDELKQRMIDMSQDPEQRMQMAQSALEHIDSYSPEIFAKNYLAACLCEAR